MSAPGEPGLYFFTDTMSRRILVEVRREPKNDGNGPLFAEAFRRDDDGAYFYCYVDNVILYTLDIIVIRSKPMISQHIANEPCGLPIHATCYS